MMRCRGADSRARRNAADPNRLSPKRNRPPELSLRGPKGAAAISGRHLQSVPASDKNVPTDCVCSGAQRAPCTGLFNRVRTLVHRRTTLTCHCEERSDVAISRNSLRIRRGFPVIRPGTARLHPKGTSSRCALRAPRPRWGLIMTHQGAWRGERCGASIRPSDCRSADGRGMPRPYSPDNGLPRNTKSPSA